MVIAIYSLIFLAVFLLVYALFNFFISRWRDWQAKQINKVTNELDDSFIFIGKRKIIIITFAPIILGSLGYLLIGNIVGIVSGVIVGLISPNFLTKMAQASRLRQCQNQLVDTLMIFSSSLKGGLSFIQALETVCEEMPEPISQEFGLILKENRLGVPLETSLNSLRKRLPIEEVNLFVSSVLVAKETGGDLTKVFKRLIDTIRDNVKLKEKITTLTLQGRLQGIIMAFLPVVFTIFIYKQSPDHFNVMLETAIGKKLIAGACILWIIGLLAIKKISTLKV